MTPHFDEKGHAELWRNELARELNEILDYVCLQNPSSLPQKAILSICARVAQFEEIKVRQ